MNTATAEVATHHQVRTFVRAPRKLLIGSKWLDAASDKTFPTYKPATGEVLAKSAVIRTVDGVAQRKMGRLPEPLRHCRETSRHHLLSPGSAPHGTNCRA